MQMCVGVFLLQSGCCLAPPKAAGWNWSLIVTVLLAALGYLVAYLNSLRLEMRKARLKYLSDQLQYLYGPLYALSHTSSLAWAEVGRKLRPDGGAVFSPETPLTEHELAQWRMWIREVCMPLNVQMEAAILANAHLIEGVTMPEPFLHLLSHTESYRAVMGQWTMNDLSEHTASTPYPKDFDPYVRTIFLKLAGEQDRLLRS